MTRTEFWDNEVKPHMKELHKKIETRDKLSQYYLGQMVFYVEHDLADGRDPRHRILQCMGVFRTPSYQNIKELVDIKEDIIKAGELLSKFFNMA